MAILIDRRVRCIDCGSTLTVHMGRCLVCRQPERYRALVEAGVPPMTAGNLARLAGKTTTAREAEKLLHTVHPILAQNIAIRKDRSLRLKNARYVWIRRAGWMRQP